MVDLHGSGRHVPDQVHQSREDVTQQEGPGPTQLGVKVAQGQRHEHGVHGQHAALLSQPVT